MSKLYYTCDKCGNPIENLNEFLLQWKHNTGINKSFECKITHESCGYSISACAAGTITCERTFEELKTKTKLIDLISTLQKLNLQESHSFLNCIKRLLTNGDVKI